MLGIRMHRTTGLDPRGETPDRHPGEGRGLVSSPNWIESSIHWRTGRGRARYYGRHGLPIRWVLDSASKVPGSPDWGLGPGLRRGDDRGVLPIGSKLAQRTSSTTRAPTGAEKFMMVGTDCRSGGSWIPPQKCRGVRTGDWAPAFAGETIGASCRSGLKWPWPTSTPAPARSTTLRPNAAAAGWTGHRPGCAGCSIILLGRSTHIAGQLNFGPLRVRMHRTTGLDPRGKTPRSSPRRRPGPSLQSGLDQVFE